MTYNCTFTYQAPSYIPWESYPDLESLSEKVKSSKFLKISLPVFSLECLPYTQGSIEKFTSNQWHQGLCSLLPFHCITPSLPDWNVIPVQKRFFQLYRLWVHATSNIYGKQRWHLHVPLPSVYTLCPFITAHKFIRRQCRLEQHTYFLEVRS